MTSTTTNPPPPPPAPAPADGAGDGAAQRSMLARVLGELLLFWSARVGLVWIALMTLLAVFAPLLASSHPLLMRTADLEALEVLARYEPGALVSPWLRHLTVVDVLLPVMLLGAVVAWAWRGVRGGHKALVVGAFAGVVLVLGLWSEHLAVFAVEGHEDLAEAWGLWREGEELIAGVPAAFPIGLLGWWLLRWVGLALLIAAVGALAGGAVLAVTRIAPYSSRVLVAGAAAIAAGAVWVALVGQLGATGWFVGAAVTLALAVTAIAKRAFALPLLTVLMVGGSMLIGGWMVHTPVSPPPVVIGGYEQYRDAAAAGEIEWQITALLPYSPDDRLRDVAVSMRFESPGRHPRDTNVADHIIRLAERSTGLTLKDVAERFADANASASEADPRRPQALLAEASGEAKVALAVELAEALFAHYLEEVPDAHPGRIRRPQSQVHEVAATPLHAQLHPLGTTQNAADMAANMIHGTRIALSVGFIATSIAITIGVFVGGLMGYFSGIFDLLGMRLVEMFDGIPTIFLLLAFMAAFGGGQGTLYILMIIIGLTSWVGYALFIRAEFLRLRQQEFVQAAEAVGAPLLTILGRHLLPNGVAPLLVVASFGVAGAIGYEATLSFLGVGLATEQSWGLLLEQALRGGAFNWWIALYPGLAIFLTVFAYILVGESLRDAIDPRTHKRAA